MKRAESVSLFAIALLACASAAFGQGQEITGWDRIRFGMVPRQIIAAYPGARFDEDRNTVTIQNPAEATVLAVCHFNEARRCSGVNVILGATDQLAVMRGLERKYGPSINHDQRFNSERYFWGNPREAIISMFLITPEWLAESRLRGTRIADYEGHVAVFYLDRPGTSPGPAWQPRPPL